MQLQDGSNSTIIMTVKVKVKKQIPTLKTPVTTATPERQI